MVDEVESFACASGGLVAGLSWGSARSRNSR